MKIEQLNKIKCINGDCMDWMKQIPDKFYDLAIVDPPYGINIGNMSMGVGKSKKSSNKKNRKWTPKSWDSNRPSDMYFEELFRVSDNQIIWGGNYFNLKPCLGFVIWDKQIPDGLSFSDCEMAWHSFNKNPKIFRYSAYRDKKNKFHPTQKPVKLYEWLLTNYAKQGDKILDTHGGSFSHTIACNNLGFDLDIIELDNDYYNEAVKRLKWHQRQGVLFDSKEMY